MQPVLPNDSWIGAGLMDFSRPVTVYQGHYRLKDEKSFRVLLACCEPRKYRTANDKVIRESCEFDLILTSDPKILGSCGNARLFHFGTSWIDDLSETRKLFSVSMICGFKNDLPGHLLRFEIWNRQKEIRMPREFWISSRGGPPSVDKNHIFSEGRSDCSRCNKATLFKGQQFSFAIENSREPGYFTEKLIDCFATKTVPIYYGDPLIHEVFNKDGMFIIRDADEAVQICNSLTDSEYQGIFEAVKENYELAKPYCIPMAERLQKEIGAAL